MGDALQVVGVTRIASFCGSLGPHSANAAALTVACRAAVAAGHETFSVTGLAAVPAFRSDQVDDPRAAVRALRSSLETCAGVLLAAPEYAGGLAGATKNALDWLVGSASIYHRPIAVLSAGTTGGSYAIEQLVRTLSWQGALVVTTLGIALPRTKVDGAGQFTDAATLHAIEDLTATLLAATDASAKQLHAMVSAVVTPYGIDAGRFGLV